MAVENTTNIAGLDDTLPTGTDTKSEGDNHLRLLKTVLKHVFAGFPGEVVLAATEAQGATANDYVLTVAPAPTAYATSTMVVFRANHANTGAATLKIGSLAAKALVNPEGTPLRANAITATTWVLAIYDGTNFRMVGGGNSQAIYDYANQLAFQAALPEQAGNNGKVLMTDGAAASWRLALASYASDALPTSDLGPIYVIGEGVAEWNAALPGYEVIFGVDVVNDLAALDGKIDFTFIYPGGTEAAPGTAIANSRYVVPNPYPGFPVFCIAETKASSGAWFNPGWANTMVNNLGEGFGMRASQLSTGEVVVQTGSLAIAASGPISGGGGGSFSPSMTTGPLRVRVWKIKGALS